MLYALASLLARTALVAAAAAGAAEVEVPRKVLALYTDSQIRSEVKDVFYLPLHQHGELPLNHLGLAVDYREASRSLPTPRELEGYRAVVTWFTEPVNLPDPRPMCGLMSRAMAAGLRVVVLGNPGVYVSAGGLTKLPPECAAMLKELGAQLDEMMTVDPLSVSVSYAQSGLMGFERRLDPSAWGIVPVVRLSPGAQVMLRLSLRAGRKSEPVGVTARGALALDPFLLYANYETDPAQFRWVLDPFAFFEAAFALKGLPRPDVTTINGRRVYMSRIDGDAFFNRSEIDRKKYSGEIFQREFLLPRSSSPFTVSYVMGYYDLSVYDDPAILSLSRDILNLPNVEPASHGYAHPLTWRTGQVALRIPRYKMDARKEIEGSSRMMDSMFLPAGKRTKLFLWTGDCVPGEGDLALVRDAGMAEMNGGGGRFDKEFPSYAYLFGLSRQVGALRQTYAPAFNENEFTGLWNERFYGYRDAVETFKNTGAPRRVKPVDVYIHFYSAELYASIKSLHGVYGWAHEQPFIPVWAGRYVDSVRDFYAMRLLRTGPRAFRALGGERMRTLRFDATGEVPDMAASRGVIGWRHELGSLYVFLDESADRKVALAARPGPGYSLEEANFEVTRWRADGERLRFDRQGWWEGSFTLRGCAPGRRYRVTSAGTTLRAAADKDGRLQVRFPDSEMGAPPREVLVEPAP